MDSNKRLLSLLSISPFTLFISSAVIAANEDLPDTQGIEEIVIEGQKIKRDLQSTLDSVTVLTGDDLNRAGIDDIRDAFNLAANIHYAPAARGNTGFLIRGIDTEGLGAGGGNPSPTASLIIDGAAQSIEGVRKGARGIWDVDSVEILRGPQLAIGRNALAGAVLINTRDPSFEFESSLRYHHDSLGNEYALMLNSPLINDELSLRIAAESRQKNLGIDYADADLNYLDEEDFYSVRAKLRYEPSALPDLSATLSVSYAYDDPAVGVVDSQDLAARFLTEPSNNVERRINRVRNYVLNLDYQLTDQLSLTSVTAFVHTDTEFQTPSANYNRDETRLDKNLSQDTRLNYYSDDGKVKAVAGLYAGNFKTLSDSIISGTANFTRTVTRSEEVGVAGPIEANACVSLDFDADGDGRWFEFFSDAFYQIDKGGQAYITSDLPNFNPVGNGLSVPYPNGGNWDNVGSLFFNNSSFSGTGSEAFDIVSANFDFEPHAANGNIAVFAGTYTTTVNSTSGTLNYTDGALSSLSASMNIALEYEFNGLLDVTEIGSLVLNDNNTFSLLVGDRNSWVRDLDNPASNVRYAWEFNGSYSIASNPSCTTAPFTITRYDAAEDKYYKTVTVTETEQVTQSGVIQDLILERKRKNLGIYAELDWNFVGQLRLISGLRYEREDVQVYQLNRQAEQAGQAEQDFDTRFSVFLPKIGLMYDFDTNQSLGFTITKGYRGGDVNISTNNGESRADEVKPESLINYEIVYRSSWLDNSLISNVNLFYYDWKDQQINQVVPDPNSQIQRTKVVNAGRSELYGAEIALLAKPSDQFDIQASLGYVHTELVDYKVNFGTLVVDYSGNEFPASPKFSAALALNYAWFNGVFSGFDINYRDEMFAKNDLANTPAKATPARTVANWRLGYEAPSGLYSITLDVKNLADHTYSQGYDSSSTAYVGTGRTVGLSTQLWF